MFNCRIQQASCWSTILALISWAHQITSYIDATTWWMLQSLQSFDNHLRGPQRVFIGHCPHVSTLCLPDIITHYEIPKFSPYVCVCILVQYWRRWTLNKILYDLSPIQWVEPDTMFLHCLASYPSSSPEKQGETLGDLITFPAKYYVWFYVPLCWLSLHFSREEPGYKASTAYCQHSPCSFLSVSIHAFFLVAYSSSSNSASANQHGDCLL